ncbi:hypothetical protein CPR19088_GLDEOEPO_01374 [Companilactobacillus paralimentarius]
MLQNNQENASYRRSLASSLDEQQAVIDEIAKESVYLEQAIDNLEYQFEHMDNLRRKYSNIFNDPFVMVKLETSLINAYSLRKCYDSELRKLASKHD